MDEDNEENIIDEVGQLEILRDRRIKCTCDEDPDWCEVHCVFG